MKKGFWISLWLLLITLFTTVGAFAIDTGLWER